MFNNLHVHTEHSLLDSSIRIPQLIERCKELGQSAIAITDHGSLGGLWQGYYESKKRGIKFIPGIETYQVDDRTKHKKGDINFHLVLLAKNKKGYKNLLKLNFEAFKTGRISIYNRDIARTDFSLLKDFGEGLIGMSACQIGLIPYLLKKNRKSEAKDVLKEYQKIFDHFFLEVQAHVTEGQEEMNAQILDFSKEINVPAVCTTDAHFLKKENHEVHDVLLAIQEKKAVNDLERKLKYDNNLYVKAENEMLAFFDKDIVERSIEISDLCDEPIYMDSNKIKLPIFKVIETEDYNDFLKWLEKKKQKGLYKE